jgi:hypothetical protein
MPIHDKTEGFLLGVRFWQNIKFIKALNEANPLGNPSPLITLLRGLFRVATIPGNFCRVHAFLLL